MYIVLKSVVLHVTRIYTTYFSTQKLQECNYLMDTKLLFIDLFVFPPDKLSLIVLV